MCTTGFLSKHCNFYHIVTLVHKRITDTIPYKWWNNTTNVRDFFSIIDFRQYYQLLIRSLIFHQKNNTKKFWYVLTILLLKCFIHLNEKQMETVKQALCRNFKIKAQGWRHQVMDFWSDCRTNNEYIDSEHIRCMFCKYLDRWFYHCYFVCIKSCL